MLVEEIDTIFYKLSQAATVLKMLGFVPQPNLQLKMLGFVPQPNLLGATTGGLPLRTTICRGITTNPFYRVLGVFACVVRVTVTNCS